MDRTGSTPRIEKASGGFMTNALLAFELTSSLVPIASALDQVTSNLGHSLPDEKFTPIVNPVQIVSEIVFHLGSPENLYQATLPRRFWPH